MSWTLHECDCMDAMRSMPDSCVKATITDPPYGMAFVSARRTPDERFRPIANDDRLFLDWIPEAYRVTSDGGTMLCFCPWMTAEAFRSAIEEAGFTVRSQVIWDRGVHGLGDLKAQFAPRHDIVWFATKGDGFEFKNGRPSSVLKVQRVAPESLTHPSEKPLGLMQSLIASVTATGDTVFDPFAGSGTTMLAAEQIGRNSIGCELDTEYCDLIKRRMSCIQQTLI